MVTEALEANKAIAREFCQRYTAGDWEGVAALFADDFRWQVPTSRRRQSTTLANAPVLNESPGWTKDETLAIFRGTQESVVDGRFDMEIVSMIAEDDRVAFEALSSAVNKHNGRIYDNRYHHLMTIREGLIVSLREYQDTLHVYDVWMAD